MDELELALKPKLNEKEKMDFAKRIRDSIVNSIGYEGVSKDTGISIPTLKRYAAGKNEPKVTDIIKISKSTSFDPIWLIFGETQDLANKEDMELITKIQRMRENEKRTAIEVLDSLALTSKIKNELKDKN